MDVLVQIKRAVLAGRYAFSEKARLEMETDGLTELDIVESIANAVAIYKKFVQPVRWGDMPKSIFTLSKAPTWKVWQFIPKGNWSKKLAQKSTIS